LTNAAETPPKVTDEAPNRLDPSTVTSIPPPTGPWSGLTELTDGTEERAP
jgi:hypothetical protein